MDAISQKRIWTFIQIVNKMIFSKDNILKYINKNRSDIDILDDFSVRDIFINASNNDANFQLTTLGYNTLNKFFESYRIQLVSKRKETTGDQILTLDRYLRTPYYINRLNTLTVYEEAIASQFIIMDGDFEAWIETKKFYK